MTTGPCRVSDSFAVSVTLLLMAVLVGFSILLCGGVLVYSLDDAYIHLSISREIARGGYGINNGELSRPILIGDLGISFWLRSQPLPSMPPFRL